ncbi:sigma-70 family RNA polymerase sigma factor [Paraburkholderia sp. NMBU_R16]|uniref:RNA polymerase sigma factor n=1 Tax=Paraburkholderia sp. NMBU_R16 TaxID=2698676 RepID=UPI001565D3B8|nr:sigma-70 family RNA polymerase sigma factor [Paraburkholderia sp. NMBU_R16]NRO97957.1 sigma-70 family RNA polymerase sigma factor [Paraburkholderia sp. NMBU_R16]
MNQVDDLAEILPSLLPRLWRFGLRLARNKEDAEDLVQRACVRALERRHQLQPGTSALSWTFSIMHSVWLNEVRARQIRSRASLEWSEELVDTVATPAGSNPELKVLYWEIMKAVDELPDAQRVVMLLVASEGLSYQEAADTLGIPIGTVMSRLARARLTIGQRFHNDGRRAVRSPASREAGNMRDPRVV